MATATATAKEAEAVPLQFVPFASYVDVGFMHVLRKKKVDELGLDSKPVRLFGYYTNGDASNLPSRLSVDYSAFDECVIPSRCFAATGELRLTNTMEEFKTSDKSALIAYLGSRIWEDIDKGLAEQEPNRLVQFLLLMFGDMKKYRFYYWFVFPALCYPKKTILLQRPVTLDKSHLKNKISLLEKALDNCTIEKAFFLLCIDDDKLSIHPLTQFSQLYSSGAKILLAFSDPSNLDLNPGWPLRNLLALAAARFSSLTTRHEVLCLRDRVRNGKRSIGHSLILFVDLVIDEEEKEKMDLPNCVGWEKNDRQKFAPRIMDVSTTMDPIKLSESSVDLNLKLMKWRLVPSLDLDKIMNTKCLLLGSGTLGCNVARALLGWGVRNIILVDNGKVSFSNPVRQTLFKFDDCLNGGKPKAVAAAAALKEIFPGLNTKGIELNIPMPGHPVDESSVEQVQKDVEQLESLIDECDVVFLLMDTRESRWLPSVMAAAKRKLVINAALGFDTYLVMRHGMKTEAEGEAATAKPSHDPAQLNCIPGDRLGCYFCNDVVAPGDSTRDRTLDQQCTVTRPGVSMLAAALAVELMVSVVHQPEGGLISATFGTRDDNNAFLEQSTTLGVVPHQIRGFLSQFYHILPAGTAFDKCTACSEVILHKYRTDGFLFLLDVFNQPSLLENFTGLTLLHDETQSAEVWELSD